MRYILTLMMVLFLWPQTAFGEPHPGGAEYLVLDRSLDQLKADFNRAEGSVRLLFVVGPTCGICLRGMADLNDAFIAEMQGDQRLQTFVVHVPTVGATEAHVAPAMSLLTGPDIYHYWDEIGIIGRHYEEVLDASTYLWDVWFAYGPEAVWQGKLPPEHAFYQHQLGPLPDELYLDDEDFARRAMALVNKLGTGQIIAANSPGEDRGEAEIGFVFQSPSRAAANYRRVALAGRRNMDAIRSIEVTGTLSRGTTETPFHTTATRPNRIVRSIPSLSAELEEKLDAAYDFEGVLLDWRRKDTELQMRGMVKTAQVLAWRMNLTTADGDQWELLVDSHTGNTIRQRLRGPEVDSYLLEVKYSDFQRTNKILFPYRVEYRDGAGVLLASEVIEEIVLRQE